MIDLIVWAADIGSVKKKRFGWCRSPFPKDSNDFEVDTNISVLAEGVAKDLSDGKKIALGFGSGKSVYLGSFCDRNIKG